MSSFLLVAGFAILFCTQSLYAQAPDISWTNTFGGAEYELAYSVQQTSDGGYILAGYTNSYGSGNYDVYLVKTDSSGDTLWTRTFGGNAYDPGFSVQQTTDGGYIIGGSTSSFGAGSSDVYLIKTDSCGDTLWTRTFGGSGYDRGYSVQQTSDGGYIVTGSTNSFGAGGDDVYLIKTDSSGDTLWTKAIGGYEWEYGFSVRQTIDEGYIITGFTDSYGAGGDDVYLIKTDSSGDTLWTKTFGGNNHDVGYDVQQTTDAGYIVSGSTESYGAGGEDVYLIKTDAIGNTLWTKIFGGYAYDCGCSVQQTIGGGYIICGYTLSFGAGGSDVYLIKTDSSGDTLWTKTVGGSNNDPGESIQQTTDGGYIVGGCTVSYGAGYSDFYLIKLDPETGIEEETEGSPLPALGSIGPNPFSSDLYISYSTPEQTNVQLTIFDLSGRVIEIIVSDQLPAGSHTAMWNPSQDTPDGCYLVVLDACGHHESGKCLKLN
ncbi:MAG: hypothetical protein K8R76_02285 [Candidatus Aegiribacteria sp.]|nr:hypothetical protein [Candidatus Aegiribacteria sp.]